MKISRKDKFEDEVHETLSKEIVRELLDQVGGPTDDASVDAMWEKVKPNPWNTPSVYRLQQAGLIK